jgi:hypothetical protein
MCDLFNDSEELEELFGTVNSVAKDLFVEFRLQIELVDDQLNLIRNKPQIRDILVAY